MTYLGQRLPVKSRDEMKVFQQICGGENICVFKGHLLPGECFQFVSKRHYGYPFSATFFVNGIMATRISSCCEYRYSIGFQQGKQGCFRVINLQGGQPCYRCASTRNWKKNTWKAEGNEEDNNFCSAPSEENLESVKRSGKKSRRSLQASRRHYQEAVSGSTDEDWHCATETGDCRRQREDVQKKRSEDISAPAGEEACTEERTSLEMAETVSSQPGNTQEETNSLIPATAMQKTKLKKPKSLKLKKKKDELENEITLNTGNMSVKYSLRDGLSHCQQESAKETELRGQLNRNTLHDKQIGITSKPENIPDQQNLLNKDVEKRQRLQEKLSSVFFTENCPSDVELSDSSDTSEYSTSYYTMQRIKRQESRPLGQHANGELLLPSVYRHNHSAMLERNERPYKGFSLKEGDTEVKSYLQPQDEHRSNGEGENKFTGPQNFKNHPSVESQPDGTLPLHIGDKELIILQVNHEMQDKAQYLRKQVDDMVTVLEASDLVEQLVLRNTGLTDDLLGRLITAMMNSPSEVEMINLNLNSIGPPGAQLLLDLLKVKPKVKGLLLFGNQLGDDGVCKLLTGLTELQMDREDELLKLQHSGERKNFTLLELDIGGNKTTSKGLRAVASFLTRHSFLQYLGLAQSNGADTEGWEEVFNSLKTNNSVSHIILDENCLGDEGAKLFAEMLKSNQSLCKVDLDSNGIGERGAHDILEALISRRGCSLEHLSLENNVIGDELLTKIHEQLKPKFL
nr:PREDICTED: uncharacterized protein LOC102685891 isoform X2 [Lepisosteus oculatus]